MQNHLLQLSLQRKAQSRLLQISVTCSIAMDRNSLASDYGTTMVMKVSKVAV